MKWYYNMKISMKLILGFIMVALIAGAVGVVGIVNIYNINNDYSEMYKDFGIAIGDIGEVSTLYQQTRVNLRDLVLDKGTDRTNYINNLKEYDKKINESLEVFQKTLRTPEGIKEYENLTNAIAKFSPIRENIINHAIANTEEEGLVIMRAPETANVVNQIETSIKNLFALKADGGIERSGQYSVAANRTIVIMIAVVLVAMLMALILGLAISRIIGNPVKKLVGAAEMIANGDLNVTVDDESKDEVGILASAFKRMAENLNEVMFNINNASEQVASGSRQVSDSSIALSQGATEQASSIEELTASLEEISSQTKQNADSADQANSLAETAKINAVEGNSQMKEMLKAMEEINESSSSISKIIKVIDEIAFQTNILALNAAVEAARAGQHGKGFAVVAEEVRNLAARSANAAKETTEMIEGSIKKVEGGTKLANMTAEALNKIVDNITVVANIVGSIAAASNEQATGIAQINQGLMQVSSVVQTNSSTSEEGAAASEELSSQAVLLKEQVSRFKLKKTRDNGIKYKGMDEIDPEVLKILENMSSKKRITAQEASTEIPLSNGSRKIVLSDKEFGKY